MLQSDQNGKIDPCNTQTSLKFELHQTTVFSVHSLGLFSGCSSSRSLNQRALEVCLLPTNIRSRSEDINISMQRRHTTDAQETLDPTCGATARASPRAPGTLWVVRESERVHWLFLNYPLPIAPRPPPAPGGHLAEQAQLNLEGLNAVLRC